jgi:hypothetical protein
MSSNAPGDDRHTLARIPLDPTDSPHPSSPTAQKDDRCHDEAGSETKRITPDTRHLVELGSEPGELIERMEKLRALLPAFAQESAEARREAARLRSQNATLQRRVAELETRSAITRDLTSHDA